jgi:hypothetical protein
MDFRLIWLAGLAFAALVARSIIVKYKHSSRARALNCKAPLTLFPGLTGAVKMMKEVKAGKFTEYIASLHEAHGPTFKEKMIGNNLISTIDPANIKALLATQFNDFGLGIRYRQFHPLLGDGIFTLDGKGWSFTRAMIRPQFAREQVCRSHCIQAKIRSNEVNWTDRLQTSPFSTDTSRK